MKRSRIVLLAALAFATAALLALSGCSSSGGSAKSGPVYMPSKVVSHSDAGAGTREDVREYEYDSNGNLAKVTYSYSRSDAKNLDLTNIYSLSYSADGMPTSYSEVQSNNKNDIFVGEWSVRVEKDSAGRYTKLEKDSCQVTFTYGKDGNIESVERNYTGLNKFEYTIEPNGYVATSGRTPKKDSSGQVTSDEYTTTSGKKVVRTYTYDDKGNVIAIADNGTKIYEIEYIEIANPSPATRAFSAILFNGNSIFWDIYS